MAYKTRGENARQYSTRVRRQEDKKAEAAALKAMRRPWTRQATPAELKAMRCPWTSRAECLAAAERAAAGVADVFFACTAHRTSRETRLLRVERDRLVRLVQLVRALKRVR